MSSFNVPIRPAIKKIAPYVPGKPIEEVEREFGVVGASKLASNENPLGPSPLAMDALRQAISDNNRYPDGYAFNLRSALSAKTGLGADRILLGNGSNELLVLLGQAVLTPGDEVVYAERSFAVYPLVAQLFEATSVLRPLKDDTHDLQALASAITQKTRLIFICNPNNPTGTAVPLLAVEALLRVCPADVLVVLDEAYYEYVDLKTYFESLKLLDQFPNLVVLRTFSKVYGLAGLRVGYGFGHPELVDAIHRTRQPFNVNAMAMAAAEGALRDTEHVKKTVELNRKTRERIAEGLREMGLQAAPSQANFVYFRVPGAPGVYDRLMRKGIIVRPMGPEALRVTTGTEEETEKFLKELKEVL